MAYGGGSRPRGFRRDFGPREMHKIKCSECGKNAEVPFKPSGDRPVFCRECYLKSKGIAPRGPRKEESEDTEEESEDSEEESEDSEEE